MNDKELIRYLERDLRILQEQTDQLRPEYLMRVLNKKYWPHQITVEDNSDVKETWCYENFKSGNWRNVGKTFAFKRGEDATLFSLRWL